MAHYKVDTVQNTTTGDFEIDNMADGPLKQRLEAIIANITNNAGIEIKPRTRRI